MMRRANDTVQNAESLIVNRFSIESDHHLADQCRMRMEAYVPGWEKTSQNLEELLTGS